MLMNREGRDYSINCDFRLDLYSVKNAKKEI